MREDTEEVLRKLGVQPVKGQNFLVDETVIEALVESGEAESKDVLEIGGGTGAITEKLLEKASELTVIEKDNTLAEHLKEKFSEAEIIEGDFLDMESIDSERCVSNLPFEISTDAVQRLGEEQIQSSVIVQKEVAEKATASPGDSNYGTFSIRCQYYFVPVNLRTVGSESFYPSPDVDGAILKLYPNEERHGLEDVDSLFTVSDALFTHKRKKVRNAFVDARHILDFEKDRAKDVRDDLPHSEERVVNLSVRQLVEVSEAVKEF